jgi:hypothetical protein
MEDGTSDGSSIHSAGWLSTSTADSNAVEKKQLILHIYSTATARCCLAAHNSKPLTFLGRPNLVV